MTLSDNQFGLIGAIMRDEAEAEKVTNPQPGQRVYRGEVRRYDASMMKNRVEEAERRHSAVRQVLSGNYISGRPVRTIGRHWTTNPDTPVEFAGATCVGTDDDPSWGRVHVQWEGVIDKPDVQIAHDEAGGQYGASHWEREVRFKENVPVRVTGAKYYIPHPEEADEPLWSKANWRHVQFREPRFPAVTRHSAVTLNEREWMEHGREIGVPEEHLQAAHRELERWGR